jgi:EAL domain-containing protein (putative c-di-GMP-specific phosphodiesterase class I)
MIESLLQTVLAPGGLRVLFQPVVRSGSSGMSAFAVEALIRGVNAANLERPDILFEYARMKRKEGLLDRACIITALRAAQQLPAHLLVSLNVHCSTLGCDDSFVPFLINESLVNGIDCKRLILELVEHAPFWNRDRFVAALSDVRKVGIMVAVDDLGSGYSNYRLLIEARPDFLKLDRVLVHDCARDLYRRAVLEAALGLGERIGAAVVAEGIETSQDLDALRLMGVELFQGYFFCRPLPAGELIGHPALLSATEAAIWPPDGALSVAASPTLATVSVSM